MNTNNDGNDYVSPLGNFAGAGGLVDRVARVKAQVRDGSYDTDAKLDAALDKMIAAHVPAYRKVRDPAPERMTWADAMKIHTAAKLGWRPQLTFPRLADDAAQDVPGQTFMFTDPNTEHDNDWDGHGHHPAA